MFIEYPNYDAIGLAELIKKREVSAREVLQAAIDRIDAINPHINAVVHKMYEIGKSELEKMDIGKPLAGVPFLLKDLNLAFQGVPLQNGSKAFRDYIPDFDSTIVSRYKTAGLVTIGKTSTPEFGLKGITEPEAYGACRNPWNTDFTPGGSSGGSAAAVAAGMVPVASGSDAGGSIRIPASHCHLFGLKPSRGRMPFGPVNGESRMGATSLHVLSRSVRDSAIILDLTKGNHPGSRSAAPNPDTPYFRLFTQKPEKLKIGFLHSSPINKGVDQHCVDAVLSTAKLLEHMGHQVEQVNWPIDAYSVGISFITMYYGEMHAKVRELPGILNRKIQKNELELTTRILAAVGKATSSGAFAEAIHTWERIALGMARYFESFDLLLTPTAAYPPVRIGQLDLSQSKAVAVQVLEFLGLLRLLKTSGLALKIAIENIKYTPFTQLANVSGLPAMSVPASWTDNSLPIGVQFIAPYGDELMLLQLARQIEIARPWYKIATP